MTLSIAVFGERDEPPFETRLELRCDGPHPAGEAPTAQFVGPGYIEEHTAAVAAGWRFLRDGGHLGPCCHKLKAETESDAPREAPRAIQLSMFP